MISEPATEPRRFPSLVFGMIVFAFLVQSAYLLLVPLNKLLTVTVVDDAFYYLQIARNVWQDKGLSFDRVHRTNGFQPLSQLVALGIGWIENKTAALRLFLGFGALFYQAVAWVLFLFCAKHFGFRRAIGAALLWELNARLAFTYSISGMEFSLYAFTTLLLVSRAETLARTNEPPTRRDWFGLGLLAGINALARLDGVIALVIVCVYEVVGLRRRNEKQAFKGLCLFYPLGGALLLMPYFIANFIAFGHLLPVSGTIKLHHNLEEIHRIRSDHSVWFAGAYLFKSGIYLSAKYWLRFATGYFYYAVRELNISQTASGVIGIILAAVLVVESLRRSAWIQSRNRFAKLELLGVIATVQFLIYVVLLTDQVNYGNWYFGPLYVFFCLAAVLLLDGLPRRWRRTISTGALAVTFLNAAVFLARHDEVKINMEGAMEALDYVERNLKGERVGSWNAGYLGYFAERNTFVNLDGLVGDYELADVHLKGTSMEEYLSKEGIRYVCDYLTDPDQINSGFYGLEPAKYEVIYQSEFRKPLYVDPRIYCVLRRR